MQKVVSMAARWRKDNADIIEVSYREYSSTHEDGYRRKIEYITLKKGKEENIRKVIFTTKLK